MKALDGSLVDKVSGVALMCSVPPSGNVPMTQRFIKSRGWKTVWDITRGFVLKAAANDLELTRKFFFSPELDPGLVEKYQKKIKPDSKPFFDLKSVVRRLPSMNALASGEASWISRNPSLRRLVIGAKNDFLVDEEGINESARFLDVSPVFVDGAHDVMLDTGKAENAEVLISWLEAK